MERITGRPEVVLGILDGPVALDHPDLTTEHIRDVPGGLSGSCSQTSSAACLHGTFIAGMLAGRRGSAAPAICPDCTFLVRPIFAEAAPGDGLLPSATPEELAEALVASVDAGARIINLSAALSQSAARDERRLTEALDYTAGRGAIVVVAAGNQGVVGSSAITRHPWVISVTACDLQGRPLAYTNIGRSIGQRGLLAPGEGITSLAAAGEPHPFGGTSVAAPLVTGAVALLWSAFPAATAAEIHLAVTHSATVRRRSVVPPILDAWGAYQRLGTMQPRRTLP
jgi:subtilisin family serine protease